MDQNNNGHKEFRCKYCGNIINPDNMFCSSCGAPITAMSRPSQSSFANKQKNVTANEASVSNNGNDMDDLPVINTDEIFKDIDYTSHINTNFDTKEDDLPVIDVEGLFDDVPFADTSGYQNTTSQYYNMNTNSSQLYGQYQAESQPGQPGVSQNGTVGQPGAGQSAYGNPSGQPRAVQDPAVRQPGRQQTGRQSFAGAVKSERRLNEQATPPMDRKTEAEDVPKKKGKKKKLLLLVVLIAIAAGMAVWYFGFYNNKHRADLLDLCTIKYTGVNGNGNIELTFNERCDLYDNFAVVDNQEACDELKKITFVASPNTGLSNGDKVTIHADYSKANLSKYKIKVKNASKEVVVEGLEDSAEYDLFSGISVTFEGYDGTGKAVLDTTGCDEFAKTNVTYSFEGNSEDLKNGDMVVVTAQVDDSILEKNYYKVTTKKKDYIVSGLLGAQQYDVFKNVSIKYSGASPRLTLSVDTSSCDDFVKNSVDFSLSDSENVASGDEITITASFDEDEAKKKGYKITTTTKKIKVTNVSSYLSEVKSSQSRALTSAITSYLTDNKTANGNGYFFDQDLDRLFDDGNSYTYKSAKEEVAGRYFLYEKDEDPINSYILILKYTVTAQCEETGETKEAVVYAESSVANIYLADDQTTIKYDFPSEVVTDLEFDYFTSEINDSGYQVKELR